MQHKRKEERGAVLLTMLLLVAVMSSIAVYMLGEVRAGIRRSTVTTDMTQAYWYGLGIEEVSKGLIRTSWQAEATRTTLDQPWAEDKGVLAVPGGGMEVGIHDAGNCFNLNSLVHWQTEEASVNEDAKAHFVNLLRALDVFESRANALANSLADWIDPDSRVREGGAEDYDYGSLNPAYRTANAPLSDISTLRAITGFDTETYQTLRPYVCALPTDEESILNVNTLQSQDAPLLVMLAGEQLSLADAEAAITARPAASYRRVEDFWAQNVFAGLETTEQSMQRTGLKTEWYQTVAHVWYEEATFAMQSLFRLGSNGDVHLIKRKTGVLD